MTALSYLSARYSMAQRSSRRPSVYMKHVSDRTGSDFELPHPARNADIIIVKISIVIVVYCFFIKDQARIPLSSTSRGGIASISSRMIVNYLSCGNVLGQGIKIAGSRRLLAVFCDAKCVEKAMCLVYNQNTCSVSPAPVFR